MKKLISILTVLMVAFFAAQTLSAQSHNPKNKYYIESTVDGVRIALADPQHQTPHILGYVFNLNDYSVVVEFEIQATPCKTDGTPIGKKGILLRSTHNMAPNSQWCFKDEDGVLKDVELVYFRVKRK